MSAVPERLDVSRHAARWTLIVLFAVSGFSGLIYESIWTQYLKLLLGHAAYAQTLVLSIFMGGMAIGSWFIGQRTTKIQNLLIGYAIVEGIVGIAGLGFHGLFSSAFDFAQSTVLPALGDSAWVEVLKWGFAALLILPQSILLGMTFPLMSGAMIRRFPNSSGTGIAALYFSNSLGAALGVLVSGFVLIPLAGLPGTVLAAGTANLLLAAVVYGWARSPRWTSSSAVVYPAAETSQSSNRVGVLLMVAALTGTASFIYEISWIRMLSMVIGASTHAFELMLSSFILGLALGSLWIRGRIQSLESPWMFLGIVQIVMGVLAIGTVVIYGQTFHWMSALMQGLERTDAGYSLYNLASHAVAIVVMLPVTICAGMTLPLITFSLLKSGFGERSVGHVYAVNTVGAIAGVLLATHIGLPYLGLKDTIIAGAAIDMVVGVALLRLGLKAVQTRTLAVVVVALLVSAAVGLELNPKLMASSVFRFGTLRALETEQLPYVGHGKTATIHVVQFADGLHGIMTNGKTDSSLQVYPERYPNRSLDEYNMSLLAALPLAAHGNAKRAAIIGFGAGLSTHVMLADPNLEVVDTIEIEPLMVEAARVFHPRVHRGFDDPRARFQFEDARTFFATHQTPYDVIASEPSTPWVSGVASLYTEEFYRGVRSNLSEKGIFAQWLHGSELSMELTSLVARTLGGVFDDYAVFNLNGHDVVFLASANGPLELDPSWPFKIPAMARELALVHLKTPQDIRVRYLGHKALLDPWFRSYGSSVNSDYFPLLDLQAVRARFKREFATELYTLREQAVPIIEMLSPRWAVARDGSITTTQEFDFATLTMNAHAFSSALMETTSLNPASVTPAWIARLGMDGLALASCGDGAGKNPWWNTTVFIATRVLPLIDPQQASKLVEHIGAICPALSQSQQRWLAMLTAVSRRDAPMMVQSASEFIAGPNETDLVRLRYAMAVKMLGYLAQDNADAALKLWQASGNATLASRETQFMLTYVQALRGSP